MSEDKRPIPEYLDARQPYKPEPDSPDTPTWPAVKKGAKWGSVAGLVGGQFYLANNSPLGFYSGNLTLVFAVWIGLGTALGAGIGWASTQKIADDDDTRPPPDFPREPYG